MARGSFALREQLFSKSVRFVGHRNLCVLASKWQTVGVRSMSYFTVWYVRPGFAIMCVQDNGQMTYDAACLVTEDYFKLNAFYREGGWLEIRDAQNKLVKSTKQNDRQLTLW